MSLTAVLLMSACGSSTDSGSKSDGTLTIGVSYPTANSPFWKAYTDFVQDGANQLGIKVNLVAADGNEQKQLSDVQNLISQGVDGIIVTPQSTSIAPSILRATTQAKIPTVVTDRYPGYEPGTNTAADYVAFIGPNDEQAGQGIEQALAAAGGTKILALGGVPGNSVAEGRKAGLEKGIAADGATVVQYQSAGGESEENGLSTAENLLQAHPKGQANAFWCYNDNLCMGAIKAVKNAGRSGEFVFGGMDLTPAAITAIEDGSYTISFGGHWLQGGFGLGILYDKIKGTDPAEKLVKLNLLKVDKTNVAEFKAKFIDNPPKYDFKQISRAENGGQTPKYEITLGN
ncbi:substrate-binding domain-containing protein [Paractinoplanes durhamensis]|uniref:substrate-binding domain-containing protein n=1 Tax=Paractinoplanes durhamensis TaxID=113563 RepID=UPI00362B9B64